MFAKTSLTSRIAVGKVVGFIIGLAGFITTPWFIPEISMTLRWGILFWYTTVGAVIGMMGVYTRHPVLNLPMPWWIRAPIMGGWMNFVLTLFAYDTLRGMMISYFGADGMFNSPYWFVLEGMIVGLIIGYLATKIAGEGEGLPVN